LTAFNLADSNFRRLSHQNEPGTTICAHWSLKQAASLYICRHAGRSGVWPMTEALYRGNASSPPHFNGVNRAGVDFVAWLGGQAQEGRFLWLRLVLGGSIQLPRRLCLRYHSRLVPAGSICGYFWHRRPSRRECGRGVRGSGHIGVSKMICLLTAWFGVRFWSSRAALSLVGVGRFKGRRRRGMFSL
jgi:hypothetical protein